MNNIQNPIIKLKEYLNQEDYKAIATLQTICLDYDKTALKLELDYKLASADEGVGAIGNINEFMYFDGHDLVGYIGIGSFGGSTLEVNGMVHPDYRRQGIFKKLYQLVIDEWTKRSSKSILLLSDRNSVSGQAFIKTIETSYKHTEYEMYLHKNEKSSLAEIIVDDIIFRKATNEDAKEVARQNAIYFESDYDETDMIMPEEEEKRGMSIYIVENNDGIIGKVHLQLINGVGGIFGLGVLPEHRSKGYGRKILLKAIEALEAMKAESIMLQVEAQNSNALNLYKSCGFVETSTMDYYELIAKD